MKWQFSIGEKPFEFSIWDNCLFQLKMHLVFWYILKKKNRRAPQFWKKGKPYPPRHRPLCAMSIYFKMMCARQKLRQTRVWTLAASGDRRTTDAEWASSLHLFIFPWKRNIFQELLVDMYVSICIYVPNWWFFNFCMYFFVFILQMLPTLVPYLKTVEVAITKYFDIITMLLRYVCN